HYTRPEDESCCSSQKHQDIGVKMKVYSYSQARQNLSDLLNQAQHEEVLIRRRDGSTFSVIAKLSPHSPFDIQGKQTQAVTPDILQAVRDSRAR
ncbi:MAG: hypothetical protein WA902_05810, partial [Thermosynechococcaceae cyanobacterium]